MIHFKGIIPRNYIEGGYVWDCDWLLWRRLAWSWNNLNIAKRHQRTDCCLPATTFSFQLLIHSYRTPDIVTSTPWTGIDCRTWNGFPIEMSGWSCNSYWWGQDILWFHKISIFHRAKLPTANLKYSYPVMQVKALQKERKLNWNVLDTWIRWRQQRKSAHPFVSTTEHPHLVFTSFVCTSVSSVYSESCKCQLQLFFLNYLMKAYRTHGWQILFSVHLKFFIQISAVPISESWLRPHP